MAGFYVGSPSLTQPSSFTWAPAIPKRHRKSYTYKTRRKKKDMEISPTKKEIQILDL
jgi:hypothetical protein